MNIKKVYYDGKLINVKDWDFEKKRPKIKSEKKAEVLPEPESQAEVVVEEEVLPE